MTKEKTLEAKRIEHHFRELEHYVDDCNAPAAIDRGYLLGILHDPKYRKKFDNLINKFRQKCDCKHR